MPELPDVEIFKRYADANALRQRVRSVEVKTPKILLGLSEQKLQKALVGRQFTSTVRHGKNLFVELDEGPWLTVHFGMTGYLAYFEKTGDDPEYDRLLISFANGSHLAFVDRRKLGRVGLTGDVEDFIRARQLGPDALNLDPVAFRQAVQRKKGNIKAFLMDQKNLAGIGNVYADEILFQSRLHPQSQAGDLEKENLEKLFQEINKVLKTAIKAGAEPEKFPEGFLLRHRRRDGNCPRGHGKFKQIKVGGRTTYFCPECQRKI